MISVERTIISQYGNSAIITQLVRDMDEHIDPRADIDAFFNFVWNVDTAQGFGLDIWGRIVNISRELTLPADPLYFGFNEAVPGAYPFDEQPFYPGAEAATQTYMMADDAYRRLIMVKALANISATDAPSLNRLLQNLFEGRGRCYVNDLGDMTMQYAFEFALTSFEFAIMTQSGALPRPAGVFAHLIQGPFPYFGFASDSAPFGQGIFIQQGATSAAI